MADEQPPGINFRKIIENVISYLVTAVFVGACAIVWRGATTVDDRVHATEKSIQVLIDNLSAKLTSYEIQLTQQSNQLAAVYTELKSTKTAAAQLDWQSKVGAIKSDERRAVIQQDISQQLQMRK